MNLLLILKKMIIKLAMHSPNIREIEETRFEIDD